MNGQMKTEKELGEMTTEPIERKNIYDLLEEEIRKSVESEAEKEKKLERLGSLRKQKVNILLTGATGSGKSSTINALFNMNKAKVGEGVDPETTAIARYELENLTIWDTPGLGDGVQRDREIRDEIIRVLQKKDENGQPLIDVVMVILDASQKDLGTSFKLINRILIPCLGKRDAKKRILVALNQSDMAMKGTHWNGGKNEPDEVLNTFLEKKAASVRARIREGTGVDITPVCYCAGYTENGVQRAPYNLTKLLSFLVRTVPSEKRFAFADNLNQKKENFRYDDQEEDYRSQIQTGFFETVFNGISQGVSAGSGLGGEILGIPGKVIGGAVGGAIGVVGGLLDAIFG